MDDDVVKGESYWLFRVRDSKQQSVTPKTERPQIDGGIAKYNKNNRNNRDNDQSYSTMPIHF